MNTYQRAKQRARNKAVKWQNTFSEHSYSYGELAYWGDYFNRLGKRYGLVKEFKENAII